MSSLANSIRKNSKRLSEAQESYRSSVESVSSYMMTVSKQFPPDYINPLSNQEAFNSTLREARGEAKQWNENVMDELISVPGNILHDSSRVSSAFDDAVEATNKLIENPNDKYAPENLDDSLAQLLHIFNHESNQVQGTLELLEDTKNNLPLIAVQLKDAAFDCEEGVKYDQGKIDELQRSISDLEQEIASLTRDIVGLGGAEAALFGVGAAAVGVAGPFGLITWIVLAPAAVVAGVYIALDSEKIKSCNKQIESITNSMDGYTIDIANLQISTKLYEDLAAQSEQAKDKLFEVQAAWALLASDLANEISDIKNSQKESQGRRYDLVHQDLVDAQAEWRKVQGQASLMNINLKYSAANLKFGMSSAQVQSAVETAQMISVGDLFD
ncbi:HBL/NHE enterotoxin family protein [Pseudomonas donghuensis]|uniref:HBL/NHE enterotoxin family protein n=1 Tax=Pseudomonas donghuensis TaxID=1163398 RepID=A0AAP0SGS9_9PSED|nr:HBL/NHE enterotoxin family protein [Pseudomonas donghuensis]KDN98956.2 HBL/NHE enterotoxin family protein [Pseudomonas donghuensis]MDF9893403.1 prefoldin subunit 5 [Pseudomonas vranovensis]